MKPRLAAAAASLALLLASAASAAPAPAPPPYEGVYQPKGVDEIGLWREADESERALAASSLVIPDDGLTAYVKKILCDTVGADRCNAARVYIMRVPIFNASMTANGTMRVYSGLLLRARNEAELGAILGHEFGHFERRHSLERFQADRSSSDVLAWAAALANLTPSYDVRRAYRDIKVSVYGNLYRYKRNHEREADTLGIGYLNRSTLRPQAAPRVWQNLMAEAEASASARGLKKPTFNTISYAASHPPEGERAAYLTELALPAGDTRDDGGERYRAALAPWLPSFLADQVKLNDFGASDYVIQSLAENGWTAQLWFARGELYRTRGNPRDLVHAAGFYAHAVALDPAMADAHRGLGLSLFKTGQRVDGQRALRTYLALKPTATDASMIRMLAPQESAEK